MYALNLACQQLANINRFNIPFIEIARRPRCQPATTRMSQANNKYQILPASDVSITCTVTQ